MKILNKSIYFILFFSAVWFCVLFSQKGGLHLDEQWTYSFSNSSIGGFFHTFDINYFDFFLNNWWDGNDIEKYFTVQKDGIFDYANVYANLRYDVHPPLYYYLLHTVSSFFTYSMNMWIGGGINVVFLVLSLFLLYKIAKFFIKDEVWAIIPVIWYGFSRGGVDTFLFIRMYGLVVFWALMFFYYSLLYFSDKEIEKKYLRLIYLAILGGCLTHFFFIIFSVCVMICYAIKYLIKKEYQKVGLFLTYGLVALISLFVLFEPSWDILRKSSRAEEINIKLQSVIGEDWRNLFSIDGINRLYVWFLEGASRFFSHLWDMSLGEINIGGETKLWISLGISVFLCFVGFFYEIVGFLALGFYLGLFFPYMWIFEGRYFMILLPFWCLFLTIFLYKILDFLSVFKNNLNLKRGVSLVLVFVFLINMSFGANSLYLFSKDNNSRLFEEEVKDKNVVLMFPEKWMFFETLFYIRGAKHFYGMISSNLNDIRDKSYVTKDTLVLIINHDSRKNLKLESKQALRIDRFYKNLKFLYIVQFGERFYDVYKVI